MSGARMVVQYSKSTVGLLINFAGKLILKHVNQMLEQFSAIDPQSSIIVMKQTTT